MGKGQRVLSDKEKYCEGIELFCSTLSSVVGRFYLSACEWLVWKRRSVAQSVGFLYSAVASLQLALMWVFMSRKDISWVKCWKGNLIVGWMWFMKSSRHLSLPRKFSLGPCCCVLWKKVFWKKFVFYFYYLHSNIAILLIPKVQNKASTYKVFFKFFLLI